MLKTSSITPIGITALPSVKGSQIRIEPGSLVFDNKWINFKGHIFDLNKYINEKLTERDTFFNGRGFAVYLVIGINFFGKLSVEEGPQVLFKLKESVPSPILQGVIPLVGLIIIQDGSKDINYGFKDITDLDLIKFSGFGNVLEKNLRGVTGSSEAARGERGITGYEGLTGFPGLLGPTGILGIQGSVGPFLIGSTGVMGLTGINYNASYDTGLDIYLKMNDQGETGTDASGNDRHVFWTGLGSSYHFSTDAVLCEGQSTVDLGQASSFTRDDEVEYTILTGPGVISDVVYIENYPIGNNKIILAEFEGVSHNFIFYIDSNGKLNFQDDTYRWVSNIKAVNKKEWTLLEFHKLSSNVGKIYRTTAINMRTELSVTRMTL